MIVRRAEQYPALTAQAQETLTRLRQWMLANPSVWVGEAQGGLSLADLPYLKGCLEEACTQIALLLALISELRQEDLAGEETPYEGLYRQLQVKEEALRQIASTSQDHTEAIGIALRASGPLGYVKVEGS